jgi:hypothetical protein
VVLASRNSQNWQETLTQGGTVLFVLTDTEAVEDPEDGAANDLGFIDAAADCSAAGNTECRSLSLYGCGNAV